MKTRIILVLLLAIMAVTLFGQEDAKEEAMKPLKPRFEELKPFMVAGFEAENAMEPKVIAGLFEKFVAVMEKIEKPVDKGIYGFTYPGEKFDMKTMEGTNYFVGMAITEDSKPPEEFQIHKNPGGHFAVFEYAGALEAVGDIYQYIYGKWLIEAGMKPAGFESFEYYGPEYNPEDPDARIEIWIPVIKIK